MDLSLAIMVLATRIEFTREQSLGKNNLLTGHKGGQYPSMTRLISGV